MYLIIIDGHWKWSEVMEMSTTTASRVIMVLRHLFFFHGLPEQIVFRDNSPQFVSDEFQQFTRAIGHGVKHIRCTPYHPSSNGAAERFVRTFKESMKAAHHEGQTT